MALIEAKILDRRFTKLIWKSLRTGHFEFHVYSDNIIGTPQGSIISPILANIYLHQLDLFVNDLSTEFNKGTHTKETKESNRLRYLIRKARANQDDDTAQNLTKLRMTLPWGKYNDPEYQKLGYVRYADDFVIAIKGSKTQATEIQDRVKTYLSSIGLALSEHKTKLTNINEDRALFLGTQIFRGKHTKYTRSTPTRTLKRNPRRLRFEAPLPRVLAKLKEPGFLKKGKPHPKFV